MWFLAFIIVAPNSSTVQTFTSVFYCGFVFNKVSKLGCGVCFTMHRMCDSPLWSINMKYVTDGD